MQEYITGYVATNLYWLGRHLERVAITLREVNKTYDKIIDIDKNAGVKLYKKFDIKLKYKNAYDFLKEAIYGEHEANILTLVTNARENAIICRHILDDDAFGAVIELHKLFSTTYIEHIEIDYKLIDEAQSLIGEIWNAQFTRDNMNLSNSFFRVGKIIEEADYRVRFDKRGNKQIIESIFRELDFFCESLTKNHENPFEIEPIEGRTLDEYLTSLNSKIDNIIID